MFSSLNLSSLYSFVCLLVRLLVRLIPDSPKVLCLPTEAFLGEKNVNIRCEVKSKPKLSAMFWIIDSNGTALAEGEVINGLWTLAVVRTTLPHRLCFR